MLEYLFNSIKATAGEDAVIIANIAEDGVDITEGCGLMLHINNKVLHYSGEYKNELWHFTIPGEDTKGLKGRFWYCLCRGEQTLCFKEPIYFV